MKTFKITLVSILFVLSGQAFGQVAINNTGTAANSSAMLDVTASGKGLLIPRMTLANRPASPVVGLLIYQTDATPGFYYYDGASWVMVGSGAGTSQWTATGNDIYNNNPESVGIGTVGAPDANAVLEIESTTKGILIPRITLANRPAAPTQGLMIYQTDGTSGFYYYGASGWLRVAAGTVPINAGGTGAITANAALNNLLPTQATHASQFLTTDGTNTSWSAAGGSGQWVASGNDIYNLNTGNVGIGTAAVPAASSILELKSSTKGFLPPRVVSTANVTGPVEGLIVYQTGVPSGLYFYTGSAWTLIPVGVVSSQWTTTGNDIYYNSGSVALGITAPNASALLDLTSTTKGLLMPRMTNAQRNAITKVNGLFIVQTDNASFNPAGVYYCNGTSWVQMTPKWSSSSSNNNLWYTTGAIGIGAVPPASPNYALTVTKNTLDYPLYVENPGGTDSNYGIRVKAGGAPPTSSAKFIAFVDGGDTEIAYIGYDGANMGFFSSSDALLKENISPSLIGLETLLQIKVRNYSWKRDTEKKTVMGFVAQELYDVYPPAVVKPKSDSDNWMINQLTLIPLIVKSIQDQNVIIKKQEEKIKSLEERLSAIELKIGQ